MKKLFSILVSAFLIILIQNNVSAQGCVAIKGTAGICSRPIEVKAAFTEYLIMRW